MANRSQLLRQKNEGQRNGKEGTVYSFAIILYFNLCYKELDFAMRHGMQTIFMGQTALVFGRKPAPGRDGRSMLAGKGH